MKKALSILLSVFLSVSFCSCQSSNSLYTSEISGGMIVNDFGAYIYDIKVDDSKTPIQVKRSEQSTSGFCFLPSCTAYDGEIIYGVDTDNNRQSLYKCMFSSKDTVESKEWVSTDQLKSSCIGQSFADFYKLQADGEYIYFIIGGAPEYRNTELDDLYKLGRISKDGKTIEFINNIRAGGFAINNGWIYYYDNGHLYNNSFDYSRTGIYKCKLDGSEVTLLKDNIHSSNLYEYNTIYCFNNKVYFVDCSEQGNCKVARMDTDGNNIEYVSDESVYDYQIDPNKNCLYCFYQHDGEGYGKKTAGAWKITSTNLDSKEESVIKDNWRLSYKYLYSYGDYLYFSSANKDDIGRINTQTKEYEKLSIVNNSNGNYDNDGFYVDNGNESLLWEKQELDN